MAWLIRGGTIVGAHSRRALDVRVRDERVVELAENLTPTAGEEVLDARGHFVLPGGVDAHTHLDMPFGDTRTADDFRTGTRAAAAGGTTTILDFATPEPGEPLPSAMDRWMALAADKAVVDYGFHMAVVEMNEHRAAELPEVVARGVSSFKGYMAYPGRLMLDDGGLLHLFRAAADLGALVSVHAENGHLVSFLESTLLAAGKRTVAHHPEAHPPEAEAEAAHRAIVLADAAGCALYLVHVSTAGALDHARSARGRGRPVFVETCPQYLLLDRGRYAAPGFQAARWVMSPPLRERAHQGALWAGVSDGTVDTVATDHCSFSMTQKELGIHDFTKIPNGAPGVGERFGLLWTEGVARGRISAERFVDLCCTSPARLFGLWPRKGVIAEGADADIVVLDPAASYTVTASSATHACDYTAYEGYEIQGLARVVLCRGRVVARDGQCVVDAGGGVYLPRRTRGWEGGAA